MTPTTLFDPESGMRRLLSALPIELDAKLVFKTFSRASCLTDSH